MTTPSGAGQPRPASGVAPRLLPVREPRRRNLAAIVMAAGLGKRMRSKRVKVLHPVAGRAMVLYAVDLADRLAASGTCVVVGHQGEQVQAVVEARDRVGRPGGQMPPLFFAEQKEQRGTGHAVMQARGVFARARSAPATDYLILNGDTPLLREATVRELLHAHETKRAAVTILTTVLADPRGYGRVIRQAGRERDGAVLRIVEDRDATQAEAAVREINVGTYVVNGSFLFEALDKIEPKNAQGEYYLTDIVGLAVERGLGVAALAVADPDEGMGVNTRRQLADAERVMRAEIAERWMEAGVTLHDPASIRIDADVSIGQDTEIFPNVAVEGRTRIGEDCTIRSHTRLSDCTLGRGVTVLDACVLREATLDDETTVGPFAHLRPGTVLKAHAKVGNFVELKKAELGEGSKANHLTYLGDARIGRRVNIGAGTITCNYDGVSKFETVIEDEVFVGSDSQFVAPVTVGRGALIAAGSTITANVPPDALAISRTAQINQPGWAARRRAVAAASAGGRREAHDSKTRPKSSGSHPADRVSGRNLTKKGKR